MSSYTLTVVEHHPVVINLTAVANPAAVSYSWYSAGRLLDEPVADGPLLTLDRVSRHKDPRSFVCVASNDEGNTTLTVHLDVQCMHITFQS